MPPREAAGALSCCPVLATSITPGIQAWASGRCAPAECELFAKGEALDVPRHDALHALRFVRLRRCNFDGERVVRSIKGDARLFKGHNAMVRIELDRKLVAPVLAELLKIFAGAVCLHMTTRKAQS